MSDQNAPAVVTLTIDDANYKGSDTGEFIYFTDRKGQTIKFKLFEGSYYFPLYELSILKQIRTFEMRPDDILLPSYPRTGTHWTFEVVSMLLNGKAETIEKWKGNYSLEFHSSEEMSGLPSPRFLNTHMKLLDCPKEVTEKGCRIIYNLRDPKDVVVSLYVLCVETKVHEYSGTFEEFLHLMFEGKAECGGIFAHYLDAEKFMAENPQVPIHYQIFEETLKNPLAEVQEISDFLGLERNEELCKAIADKCHFSKMVVDKDKFTFKVDGKNVLFRKGIVGDWKNWFTDEMLEEYYRVYDEKMKGSRFYERYARNK